MSPSDQRCQGEGLDVDMTTVAPKIMWSLQTDCGCYEAGRFNRPEVDHEVLMNDLPSWCVNFGVVLQNRGRGVGNVKKVNRELLLRNCPNRDSNGDLIRVSNEFLRRD